MSALGQEQICAAHKRMSALPPKADIVCDRVRIMKPVTIASIRVHGVSRLLVYCNGKRDGDWPRASCRSSNSAQRKRCPTFNAVAAARSADATCHLRPDYSRQQAALYGGGWMMPPAKA